jgi:hypothetical protein
MHHKLACRGEMLSILEACLPARAVCEASYARIPRPSNCGLTVLVFVVPGVYLLEIWSRKAPRALGKLITPLS